MAIFVGLGANLAHPRLGPPVATLTAALGTLEGQGIRCARRSHWYRSAPVPASDQPWFVNGIVEIIVNYSPNELLTKLHAVEAAFGRIRRRRFEARVLDLDLIAFDDRLSNGCPAEGEPALPHPRMQERAFVLLPLAELVPDWRHPGLGLDIAALIARLPPEQTIERLPDRPAATSGGA